MPKRYKLLFSGEIIDGHDPEEVKEKLQALLKVDSNGINRFFSGQPMVIKRNADHAMTVKYSKAFEKAGAVCDVVPMESEEGVLETKPPPLPPKGGSSIVVCPMCVYEQEPGDECIKCGAQLTLNSKTVAQPQSATVAQNNSAAPSASMSPTRTVMTGDMILTNVETVPGRVIVEHFGLVSGSTIRAKNVIRDWMAGLKNIIGGELKGYTELLRESREQAIERMKDEARQLGANAIVNIRFSTSSVAQGAAELYAYGTAVRVE